jgi:predicted permease
MATALLMGILAATSLLMAARRWLPLDGPAFTSVVQGAIRPNVYVAVASAAALFGPSALGYVAIGLASVVPTVNVVSVIVLQRWGTGAGGRGIRAVILGLARNPIILAVAAGAVLTLLDLGRLPVVAPTIQALGSASLPLGLLAVGAGLDLAAARGAGTGVAVSAALKLLVVPVITGTVARALGLEGAALAVLVLFNAAPGAAASYVLARQMGGDHRLMAGIITAETMLAALSTPLVLSIFT